MLAILTAAANLLALAVKFLPTIERIGDMLYEVYTASRKARNEGQSGKLAARDAAAIAAARTGMPELCATCPFAGAGERRDGGATGSP